MSGPEPDTTDDAVLGGRLRLRQKKRGHRVGHDAILLAAATAARARRPRGRIRRRRRRCGAGAGGALSRAGRDAGRDRSGACGDCCGEHRDATALAERVRAVALDVTAPARRIRRRTASRPGSADRVLMNPPFNDPARQNVSPDPARRAAHAAAEALLAHWVDAAARLLAFRGHADADLARGRLGGGAGRAWTAASARSRCCRSTPRRGARDPRPGRAEGQPRAARALPGLMLNDGRGSRPRRRKRCCAARRRCRWLAIEQ